jgi:hypothetical protein
MYKTSIPLQTIIHLYADSLISKDEALNMLLPSYIDTPLYKLLESI